MSQNSPKDESVTIHRTLFDSSFPLSHEMVEPCLFSPAEPVDCYGFTDACTECLISIICGTFGEVSSAPPLAKKSLRVDEEVILI